MAYPQNVATFQYLIIISLNLLLGKLLTMADLQPLTTHLQSLGPKWKRLGLILGLDPEVLAQVSEGEATSDLLVYLRKMLTIWLQQKGHPPTLEALIRALSHEGIGKRNLAQLLQGKKTVQIL